MKKEFESRFMPNVKFLIPKDMLNDLLLQVLYSSIRCECRSPFPVGAVTSDDGHTIKVISNSIDSYNYFNHILEVSIFEAMPELIPDGMRYNKELDKLVPDVVSDESAYNSGIKVEFEKVADYTKENHRDYNVGSSNYAAMKIQPWDVWRAWALNPWDADIVKRIARTKNIPGISIQEARIEDYEKIIHNCKERISQLKEEINVK